MGLFELDFKVRHECALGTIARDFPGIRIMRWCKNGRDVLEIVIGDNIEVDRETLVDRISNAVSIVDRMTVSKKLHIIAQNCSCSIEDLLDNEMQETGLIQLSPVVYRKGWEYHRVIAMSQSDIDHLMGQLRERSIFPYILRKVPFDGFTGGSMTFTADSLFADLTEKQMSAIMTAYRYGYYELPRKNDLKTIASKTQVARTTYQEHLKKAEKKIIDGLAPHLHAWFHFYGSDKGERVTEFSYWMNDAHDKEVESA